MMQHIKFRVLIVSLVAILAISHLSYAQDDAGNAPPVVMWTSGQFVEDSVFYSVFLMNGEEGLTDLTITSIVPDSATFEGAFWKPEAAVLIGEADGTVTWQLDNIAANTVVGPFSYSVSFEDDTAAPTNVAANVALTDTVIDAWVIDAP